MTHRSYQEILNLITMPSRYLGSEINTVKKRPDRIRLKMALAFPDLYEIGTSHFGIQILYSILNSHPDIAAERVFCPAADMQYQLEKKNIPLLSLESATPLTCFDIIGFSLLYELNYTNILTMLKLSGIPFNAGQRDDSCPLIIAGGPCACNPEPVAELFDAVVFGDGEEVCLQMAHQFIKCRAAGITQKEEVLKHWSRIEGVYIPSFFENRKVRVANAHTIIPYPLYPNHSVISKAVVTDLNQAPFPEKPVVPFARPVHDRLRMEIARGCSRGCRFCQAGMIYRPVRERHGQRIVDLLEKCVLSTGYEDISLLSLSCGDYSEIQELLENLMSKYHDKHIAVSLPSLRAGTLTPSLMEQIKRVRKTGFTIAPEAGSQRLRDVINKNIDEEQIIRTIRDAVKLGWKTIKLYFMIGLPTETREDLAETVKFIKSIKKIKGLEKDHFNINASFTTFIPKPHTPFQWARQFPLEYSREMISWFRNELHGRGIQIKWQQPEISQIEGMFARGDRRLTRLLVRAFENGCRLDGWSDHFSYARWIESARETGIDPDFYTARQRDIGEPLPWDHMDCRIHKGFFMEEWSRAMEATLTPDCKNGACHQCGICDFKKIHPVFSRGSCLQDIGISAGKDQKAGVEGIKSGQSEKMMVVYAKMGDAKYFGHLELVNIFVRALKRAGIAVVHSNGYHPMPKISFEDPLPLGMESLEELFLVHTGDKLEPDDMARRLNMSLPEPLKVIRCGKVDKKFKIPEISKITYGIELINSEFDPGKLEFFWNSEKFIVQKTNKRKKAIDVDLKTLIESIRILDKKKLLMVIVFQPGKNLRPSEIIKHIFGLSDQNLLQARIIKQAVERKDRNV